MDADAGNSLSGGAGAGLGGERGRGVWPRVVGLFVGGAFAIAAAGKVSEPVRFSKVIAWLLAQVGASSWSAGHVAAWVCAGEGALAALLILNPRSRLSIAGAVAALTALSGALVVMLVRPNPPACGCFSILHAARDSIGDARLGLVRNAVLIAMLLASWNAAERRSGVVGVRRLGTASVRGAPGFTLLELLVVFSVLAVLSALTLPSLSRVRESARSASSTSMSRQLVAVLALYQSDYADTFPYFQTPGRPDRPAVLPTVTLRTSVGYFRAGCGYWPNLLRPAYLSEATAWSLCIDPDRTAASNVEDGYPQDTVRTRYNLSATVFARSSYWHTESEPESTSDMSATKGAMVSFPSAKGLVLDIVGGFLAPARLSRPNGSEDSLVGFADGSAGVLDWHAPAGTGVVKRYYGAMAFPVISTRDGLSGRDR